MRCWLSLVGRHPTLLGPRITSVRSRKSPIGPGVRSRLVLHTAHHILVRVGARERRPSVRCRAGLQPGEHRQERSSTGRSAIRFAQDRWRRNLSSDQRSTPFQPAAYKAEGLPSAAPPAARFSDCACRPARGRRRDTYAAVPAVRSSARNDFTARLQVLRALPFPVPPQNQQESTAKEHARLAATQRSCTTLKERQERGNAQQLRRVSRTVLSHSPQCCSTRLRHCRGGRAGSRSVASHRRGHRPTPGASHRT